MSIPLEQLGSISNHTRIYILKFFQLMVYGKVATSRVRVIAPLGPSRGRCSEWRLAGCCECSKGATFQRLELVGVSRVRNYFEGCIFGEIRVYVNRESGKCAARACCAHRMWLRFGAGTSQRIGSITRSVLPRLELLALADTPDASSTDSRIPARLAHCSLTLKHRFRLCRLTAFCTS